MSLVVNDDYDSRRDALPTFDGTAEDWDYWAWSVTGDLTNMEPIGSYLKFIERPMDQIQAEILQKHTDLAIAADAAALATANAAHAALLAAVAGGGQDPGAFVPPAPIIVADNAEYKAEMKQALRHRHKVSRMILRACKQQAIRALQGVNQQCAYAIWQRLLTEYQGIGLASVDQTYITIWKMKADPAKPISALISEMNKLFDRVAYYGEPASDRVKGAALKAALPKKLDVLKTALAPWKNLSYKQICEELVSHDTTNKTTYKSPTATGPVTPAPIVPTSYASTVPPSDVQCYNCQKQGHVSSECKAPCKRPRHGGHLGKDCRSLLQNRTPSNATKKSTVGRGRMTSVAHQARQRKEKRRVVVTTSSKNLKPRTIIVQDGSTNKKAKHSNVAGQTSGSDSEEFLFGNMISSAALSAKREPILGFDPCSSYHIACKQQVLRNPRQLPPVSVRVANGDKVKLTQGGDLHVSIFDQKGNEKELVLMGAYQSPTILNMNLLSMGLLDKAGYSSATYKGKLAISSNPPGAMFKEGIIATGYRHPEANIFVIQTEKDQDAQAHFASP